MGPNHLSHNKLKGKRGLCLGPWWIEFWQITPQGPEPFALQIDMRGGGIRT